MHCDHFPFYDVDRCQDALEEVGEEYNLIKKKLEDMLEVIQHVYNP
jgi:hypothetical protein